MDTDRLEELRERLRANPPTIPTDLDEETAQTLALDIFKGYEREVADRYLTGYRDSRGIAVKRGDPIVVTDESRKDFGQTVPVTRTITEERDGEQVRLIAGKGGFITPLADVRRAEVDDPIPDILAALFAVLHETRD